MLDWNTRFTSTADSSAQTEATAMRLLPARFWFRLDLMVLSVVIFGVSLFGIVLVRDLGGGAAPLIILCFGPLIAFVILTVPRRLSGDVESGDNERSVPPHTALHGPTIRGDAGHRIEEWSVARVKRAKRWSDLRRLVGRLFAGLGLMIVLPAWTVVAIADAFERAVFRPRRPRRRLPELSRSVQEHLSGVIQDCVWRNGWKDCVIGVKLVPLPMDTPNESVRDGPKVFEVALEDECGEVRWAWVRFGDGQVDFHWADDFTAPAWFPVTIPPPPSLPLPRPREPAESPADRAKDPLWDRWLDG